MKQYRFFTIIAAAITGLLILFSGEFVRLQGQAPQGNLEPLEEVVLREEVSFELRFVHDHFGERTFGYRWLFRAILDFA